jgi:hypothetical protein
MTAQANTFFAPLRLCVIKTLSAILTLTLTLKAHFVIDARYIAVPFAVIFL